MTAPKSDLPFTSEDYNGLTHSLPFLLAGLEGHVKEFELFGVTLQRTDSGDFRCILRGQRRAGADSSVRLVSFTNADLASECLLFAEGGFRDGLARWTLDQYATSNGQNGKAGSKPDQLTLFD